MERVFRRTVEQDGFLADEASLNAYSYDASGLMAKPNLVLRPKNEEQVRRILQTANQHHTVVVPRGAGTGLRAGAIAEQAIIVDMRPFDIIERLDKQRGTVDVGAGVTVERLNRALEKYDFHFPLVPANPASTIGGLAAINQVTEESMRFGDYIDVTERVECFDGLGRFQTLKGKDVAKVLGCEGTTGVITKLRVKVVKLSRCTLEVIPVQTPAELIAETEKQSANEHLLALEFCDARCSLLLGLAEELHLLAFYDDDSGAYKDVLKVNELRTKRKHLIETLWKEGYRHPEDVSLGPERIAAFLGLCAEEKLPCYGHIGAGILLTQLPPTMKRTTFWNKVVALGATPGGKYGYGRLKESYTPDAVRRKVIKLREERDYNVVLNKGVFS